MASSSPDLPVIRFGSTANPFDRELSWVLWPTLAWRVIGPRERPRTLNTFQRAALGLIVSGRREIESVGERLGLHRDLSAQIFLELEQLGALGPDYRPKERANDLLAETDEALEEELVVGHVFTDPFEGDLWPRFVEEDLLPIEIERGERRLVCMIGSRGSPSEIKPHFVEMPKAPVKRRPSPEAILEAARAHRRSRRGASRDEIGAASVECLDEAPTAYFLLTQVREDGVERVAEDPFGFGESDRYLRALERRIQSERQAFGSSRLESYLQRNHRACEKAGSIQELHAAALREVDDRLGAPLRRYETLRERLAAVVRAREEALAKGSPRDKRDDVFVKAQRAAERLFREVHERVGLGDVSAALSCDATYNAQLMHGLAANLGFDSPLPKGIERGAIEVAKAGAGSLNGLRGMLATTLLSTSGRDWPGLRALAAQEPSLLTRLDALTAARNPSAHDTDRERSDDVAMATEAVLRAAELCLKHLL